MPRIKTNGIEIEYEEFGASQDPLIILIAGFGEQMGGVEFPSDFCQDLSSKGLRVVRFDNRDVGLSTHFTATVSESGIAPYTLVDMSDDVVGLVAPLGVDATHLVGASMGGYIARWMAIRHPALVRSLSLIMTPRGAKRGTEAHEPAPQALERMLGKAQAGDRKAAVTAYVEAWRSYNGPRFPFDETWVRRCGEYTYDRAYDPSGVARQFAAIIDSPELLDAQAGITCPTVVIHGDADPLVGVDHAREIASRISGARLKLISGMGHEMPRQAWPELFAAILDIVRLK
jgi:pimeloyl-ACP methyl ester carboxylesterase